LATCTISRPDASLEKFKVNQTKSNQIKPDQTKPYYSRTRAEIAQMVSVLKLETQRANKGRGIQASQTGQSRTEHE
jgi:hypothetical protein